VTACESGRNPVAVGIAILFGDVADRIILVGQGIIRRPGTVVAADLAQPAKLIVDKTPDLSGDDILNRTDIAHTVIGVVAILDIRSGCIRGVDTGPAQIGIILIVGHHPVAMLNMSLLPSGVIGRGGDGLDRFIVHRGTQKYYQPNAIFPIL